MEFLVRSKDSSPPTQNSEEPDKLLELAKLVDWDAFRRFEVDLYKNKSERGGRPNIDIIIMTKHLLLQQLYGLSDPQLELQVANRISFRIFLDCAHPMACRKVFICNSKNIFIAEAMVMQLLKEWLLEETVFMINSGYITKMDNLEALNEFERKLQNIDGGCINLIGRTCFRRIAIRRCKHQS